MKNEIIELNQTTIKDKMYTIRNKKVMLDSNLAEIYGYTTKTVNYPSSKVNGIATKFLSKKQIIKSMIAVSIII